MKVVVVGAGFSGLMAAFDAAGLGHEVIVLEAGERVGGRVWSQALVPGDDRTMVERGAEFVLDGYRELHAVVDLLGLNLASAGMSYYVREPRGGAPTDLGSMAAIARLLGQAAERVGPDTSLAEVAASFDQDPAALEACLSRLELTNGEQADVLSSAVTLGAMSGFLPIPSQRVAGGNQGIARALAARLGSAVHLDTAVTGVEHSPGGVRVRTATGTVEADAVILTIPMAVLRHLPITPAPPPRITAAWGRATLGHNAKLHIPLRAPTVPSAVLSVPHRFWTWTATDASGQVQPVLHAFGGSPQALERLEVDQGPATWARRVAELRPELDLELDAAELTTWVDNPLAGESYSVTSTSVLAEDNELLVQPFGRVLIAGEHTSAEWSGLMEGALRSGRRAASQLQGVETQ